MWPDHWPKTTQRIASATDAALVAARAGASEVFGDALDDLVGLPYETVTAVHAGMMRELFEELHPDGLTGEDVQTVLPRAVRDGVRWLPSMQPNAVVAVITGALGVQDVEATDPRIAPEQYLTAARNISRLAIGSTPPPTDESFRLTPAVSQEDHAEGLPRDPARRRARGASADGPEAGA